MILIRVLECSIKGDIRFSPEYATVCVFGIRDTIKNHYMNCQKNKQNKVIQIGEEPSYLVINSCIVNKIYLNDYLTILWIKYLDNHEELVKVLKEYDYYTDMFNGQYKTDNQIEIFDKYIHKGKSYLLEECKDFLELFHRYLNKL